MTWLGLGLFAATGLAVAAGARFAKRRTKVLAQGRSDIKQFTAAATALIEDLTLPESVADFVALLSRQVGRPYMAWWIAGEILSGRIYEKPKPPKNEASRLFREDMGRLNGDQRQSLAQCVAYCLTSSAAADVFFAVYLRRVISFGLFEPDTKSVSDAEKTRAIVVEYSVKHLNKERHERVLEHV